MRQGSAPNFCPPTEEGIIVQIEDEGGAVTDFEFLGLVLLKGRRYGFFFPISEESPALSDGEVVVLEVTALDEDDQPSEFELVMDDAIAQEAYEAFMEAAKDLYDFA